MTTLLDWVGLTAAADSRLRTYSKGMLQRIGIAQALVHDPSVVFLDEPMSGLDPLGRKDVRDLILRLRSEGKTVFINSHLLSEIELVSDRVAIVDHGRVVTTGRLDSLAAGVAELRLGVEPIDPALFALLARFGTPRTAADGTLTLEVERLDTAPAVAAALVHAGYRLQALTPVQRSLEDLFLALVEHRVT